MIPTIPRSTTQTILLPPPSEDPTENPSEDPTVDPTEEDTSKGATASQKATYVNALESGLFGLFTSTTGYEVTADYTFASSYTGSTYSTSSAQSIEGTLKTVYGQNGLSADFDYSACFTYEQTDSDGEYSDTEYSYASIRLRDSEYAYIGDMYSETELTSTEIADMLYAKYSLTELTGMDIGSYVDLLVSYVGGTYEAEEGADYDLGAIADLAINVLNSPLCAVYGTISGTTLKLDVLEEIEYLATCVTALSATITDTTTISSLMDNTVIKAFAELYLGNLTGQDVYTALTLAANMGFSLVETLPEATEGQTAYEYIVAVLTQILTANEMADASVVEMVGATSAAELQTYIAGMVDEVTTMFADYSELSLSITIDNNSKLSGLAFVLDCDATGNTADYSINLTFEEKAVTLATIDNSKVCVDSVIAYDTDSNMATAYLMADNTIVLGTNDGYAATGIAYTVDEYGEIASIGGSSTKEGVFVYNHDIFVYGITFTYNDMLYVCGDSSVYENKILESEDDTSTYYVMYIGSYSYGNYDSDNITANVYLYKVTEGTYEYVATGVATFTSDYEPVTESITLSNGSSITVTAGYVELDYEYNYAYSYSYTVGEIVYEYNSEFWY